MVFLSAHHLVRGQIQDLTTWVVGYDKRVDCGVKAVRGVLGRAPSGIQGQLKAFCTLYTKERLIVVLCE